MDMILDPHAQIKKVQNWGDYFLFSMTSPAIASQAEPGQFLMVRIQDRYEPLLRRPFSIHAAKEDTLDIFFQIAGVGTRLLSQKQIGNTLDILGPLGKGFSLGVKPSSSRAALVGGGRGIAPLYFLAEQLRQRQMEVKVYYGGKTHQDLPLKERFQAAGFDTICATDDGSIGFHGTVTECFSQSIAEQIPDLVYTCGPDPMLKVIAEMTQEKQIPAEISLEAIMGCGFGACWGCVHKLKQNGQTGWHKICEQGPVFPAQDIIWQDEKT